MCQVSFVRWKLHVAGRGFEVLMPLSLQLEQHI